MASQLTNTEHEALEGGALAQDPLSGRQRAFVAAYLEHHDPGRAAIEAGYSPKTPRAIASHLLRNPLVAAEIERAEAQVLREIQRESGVTLQRTLTELAKLAFFDVRQLYNPDGSPKEITDLDDITAAAIVGVDTLEQWQGSGEDRVFVGTTKKFRVADRKAALDMLMKHLGAYKADNEQPGRGTVNALGELLANMRGSTLPVVLEASSDA